MSQYVNFTSLPPEEEQTFVVYEQRSQESAKKAVVAGLIAGAAVFLIALVLVLSHDKPKNLMEGEDMGMLAGDKEKAAARQHLEDTKSAPAPDTSGAAAPAGDADKPATPDTGDTNDEDTAGDTAGTDDTAE